MEKYGGVLNLNCEYKFKNEVFNWSANVLALITGSVNKHVNYYNIEGPFNLDGSIAYIIGLSGLGGGQLRFTVFTKDNNIIEYNLIYDYNQKCYYGSWHLLDNNKSKFSGYAKIVVSKYEMSMSCMNDKIEKYGYQMFYPKYSNLVSKLLITNAATANEYTLNYKNEMYRYSKNYFLTERLFTEKKLVNKM